MDIPSAPAQSICQQCQEQVDLDFDFTMAFQYLFTRTGLTASVLPGWDNLSSRCTP